MERLFLEDNVGGCVHKAVQVLRAGGVVLYPTDTLYGLGADALSDEAVAKIYAIKGREEKKPSHAIVADIEMAERYAVVSDKARRLVEEFWPGALTLVLKKREGIESGICRNLSTIGIRIPDNEFCLELAREFGKPVTTTSANKAGEKPERSVEEILTQLGDAVQHVGLVIDAGELPEREPSSVVDVSGSEAVILREGAISAASLRPPSHKASEGRSRTGIVRDPGYRTNANFASCKAVRPCENGNMDFERRMANTPEGHLLKKESNTRREAGSFEEHAGDYADQARNALAGNDIAAVLARGEIAKANISPRWPTKDALMVLAGTLDRLKPSVLESIPKEEIERLAFTLALVGAHSKSLH